MLTLNVGLSRKVGLPEYSSVGADCHLALELPGDLLDHPEELRKRIQTAYAVAAQAVQDELERQTAQEPARPPVGSNGTNGHTPGRQLARNGAGGFYGRGNGNGNHPKRDRPDGRGEEIRGGSAPASEKQVKLLMGLAKRAGLDLDTLYTESEVFNPSDLTIRKASEIIDRLKSQDSDAY